MDERMTEQTNKFGCGNLSCF